MIQLVNSIIEWKLEYFVIEKLPFSNIGVMAVQQYIIIFTHANKSSQCGRLEYISVLYTFAIL